MYLRKIVIGLGTAAALAGCATTQPGYSSYPSGNYSSPSYSSTARCADCGIVTRINGVQSTSTAPSATGAVLGGIVGAVAGRTISHETGGSKGNQNVATVLGAGAGAVAGNAIQKNTSGGSYDIQVKMDDGRVIVVNQRDLGGIRENTYVRVVNGKVVLR
ncbi:MAG TPA: glycine zipper 2TM domain-containing protein [Stenotrophomonas sp.]